MQNPTPQALHKQVSEFTGQVKALKSWVRENCPRATPQSCEEVRPLLSSTLATSGDIRFKLMAYFAENRTPPELDLAAIDLQEIYSRTHLETVDPQNKLAGLLKKTEFATIPSQVVQHVILPALTEAQVQATAGTSRALCKDANSDITRRHQREIEKGLSNLQEIPEVTQEEAEQARRVFPDTQIKKMNSFKAPQSAVSAGFYKAVMGSYPARGMWKRTWEHPLEPMSKADYLNLTRQWDKNPDLAINFLTDEERAKC